jgi:hypothetical protein
MIDTASSLGNVMKGRMIPPSAGRAAELHVLPLVISSKYQRDLTLIRRSQVGLSDMKLVLAVPPVKRIL